MSSPKTHFLIEYWSDPSHEADRCDTWVSLCGRVDVEKYTENTDETDCKSCQKALAGGANDQG